MLNPFDSVDKMNIIFQNKCINPANPVILSSVYPRRPKPVATAYSTRLTPYSLEILYISVPEYDKLKLLLQRGKSGTIFPWTAKGTACQLQYDGERNFTRSGLPSLSAMTQ